MTVKIQKNIVVFDVKKNTIIEGLFRIFIMSVESIVGGVEIIINRLS